MYPVLVKSTRNFRAPPSNSARTACFNSCRFPTMSWPSTSTMTTSPVSRFTSNAIALVSLLGSERDPEGCALESPLRRNPPSGDRESYP